MFRVSIEINTAERLFDEAVKISANVKISCRDTVVLNRGIPADASRLSDFQVITR